MRTAIIASVLALTMLFAGTAAIAANVHSIGSNDTMYLNDYDTGIWYNNTIGTAVVSWYDTPDTGYCYARIRPALSPYKLVYEFELVDVWTTNDDEIWGLWDVYRNGTLVVDGHEGKAYGLDLPVGDYFKIYIADNPPPAPWAEEWHMSAYIVDRFDY